MLEVRSAAQPLASSALAVQEEIEHIEISDDVHRSLQHANSLGRRDGLVEVGPDDANIVRRGGATARLQEKRL